MFLDQQQFIMARQHIILISTDSFLEGAWRLDVRIATLSAILNQEQEQADL
jgi:hypothetical protein